MTQERSWISIMLALVLLTAGCSVEDYNVVIKNVGEETVEDAHIVYGGFRSVGGILPPDIWSKHMHPDHPIPSTVTVVWRTDDGQMHRQEVEVKNLVPRGFRGDIVFEIADDHTVTLRVVPREKIKY